MLNNKLGVIEKIIRNKVYNCLYWKEKCFGLTSESIIDNALELKYIGGMINSLNQPSDFICLVVKMIQLNPKEDIIDEYLSIPEYKYLRALTAFYIRVTFPFVKVYQKLEGMYCDYRKLRLCSREGKYSITHMDEYIDDLITKEMVLDITLPSLPKRIVFENNNELMPKVSLLETDLILNNANTEGEDIDNANDELNADDIFDDIKIPDEFFKGKRKRAFKVEDNHSDQEDISIANIKKHKVSETKTNIIASQAKNNNNDTKEIPLDENSPEYWLELRKKIGL